MIYITGDMHGDLERFKQKALKPLQRGDSLIVCGDFGFIWDGSQRENKILHKIGKFKFNVLFLEGTHDNISQISQYPTEMWNGGLVRRISGNLLKLERGSIYTIEGKTIFAFGGGESLDMDERLRDSMWWPEELPDENELEQARNNLDASGNVVDYMITHECGTKVKRFIDMETDHINPMTAFFDSIAEDVLYKGWYFGCYHLDKIIPPRFHAIFQGVEKLE